MAEILRLKQEAVLLKQACRPVPFSTHMPNWGSLYGAGGLGSLLKGSVEAGRWEAHWQLVFGLCFLRLGNQGWRFCEGIT